MATSMPMATGMPPAPPGDEDEEYGYKEYTFEDAKLGIALAGAKGEDVSIGRVLEDSPAAKAGVPVGLYVAEVNGTNVKGLDKKAVQGLLIGSARPLTLRVQKTRPKKVAVTDENMAEILLGGANIVDTPKPPKFKKWDDGMTATALVESLDTFTKGKLAELATYGSSTTPPPSKAEVVVVGAGMAGLGIASEMSGDCAGSLAILEKSKSAGGVWCSQANSYSRVNSSEPSYRLRYAQADSITPKSTFTNHTPAHQIVEGFMKTMKRYNLVDKLHLLCTVDSIRAAGEGVKGWTVAGVNDGTKAAFSTTCKLAVLCTNRRLGVPRDVSYPGEDIFRGVIARGLNSDAEAITWAHKTVIVGMGAFALEHMRTALERGSQHCTIIARRRGTVCPQAVDWVNFVRPFGDDFMKDTTGSSIIQMAWNETYEKSGATKPECWKEEKILKPDGHTVSTSDLFFVAHWLEMGWTMLGEIDRFHKTSVVTKKGEDIPCGIVIKCVGFHINTTNEKILNKKHFRPTGLIDENLWCILEAHLDASVFKLPFGSSYLCAVQFQSRLIKAAYLKPEITAKLLTVPATSNISKFTSGEMNDSILETKKVFPEIHDFMVDQMTEVRGRCNAAMSFKEYLDRNEVMWREYHEMLYVRCTMLRPKEKGLLPWGFRQFEQIVEDELRVAA